MRHALQLFNDWDNLFSGSWTTPQIVSPRNVFEPTADVEETDSHYLVSVDLPGLARSDIKIEVKDDYLTIWGERKSEEKEEREEVRFNRRSFGKFTKTFSLPSGIDVSKVEASHKDGVLSVAVPKAPEAQAHTVKIGETKTGFFEKFRAKKSEVRDVH